MDEREFPLLVLNEPREGHRARTGRWPQESRSSPWADTCQESRDFRLPISCLPTMWVGSAEDPDPQVNGNSTGPLEFGGKLITGPSNIYNTYGLFIYLCWWLNFRKKNIYMKSLCAIGKGSGKYGKCGFLSIIVNILSCIWDCLCWLLFYP